MRPHKLTIPGHAVPAQRMTRKSKWSKRARKSLDYQEQVAQEAMVAGIPKFRGPVKLTMRFYFANRIHGDLSNLVKAIEDGLQYRGVVENDKQVLRYGEGTGIYYDATERAEVEIEEVELDEQQTG